MKKKMTVLCGLLMAVFVTAYSVSGTYAKYTSGMSTTDTARVARWSINVGDSSAKTLNLFSKTYGDNGEVVADTLVVAPGTSGSYTFEFDGTTEVAYTLVTKATITKNTVKYSDGVSPIKFSIDEGKTWFEATELEAKLQDAIDGEYEAGNVAIDSITLQWKWAYDATDLATMTGIVASTDPDFDYDVEDTKLGQSFVKAYNDAYDASIADSLKAYADVDTIEDLKAMIGNGITQEAYDAIISAAKTAGENAQKAEGVEPTITLDITITATQVQP